MNTVKVVGSFIEIPLTPPTSSDCDIIEIRLDAQLKLSEVTEFLQTTEQAKLFVARDPKEGGLNPEFSSPTSRMEALREVLSMADYIDIEKNNWSQMQPILEDAINLNCKTIASYHDFSKTPSYEELESLLEHALSTDADILKFAFMIRENEDIDRCLALLQRHQGLPISIMGMGALGAKSRILLGKAGSLLNYGFLGSKETAPGQISATELKRKLLA